MDKNYIKQLGVLAGLLLTPMVWADNLLDVYESARSNDATYLAAIAEYNAAREASPQAWSAVLPQINLQGTHAKVDRNTTSVNSSFITLGKRNFTNDIYSLTLTQTIFRKKQFEQINQADAQVAQAQADFENKKHELILRVAQRYFDVLGTKDTLIFAQAEKQAIEQQLLQARERFKVGLTAITDVHEAQARYDQAVASEIEASNQYAISLEALREITNVQPGPLARLGKQTPLVSPQPTDINAWVKIAIDNNLLLLAADKSREAARYALKAERAGHYPTLDFAAEYNDSKNDDPDFGNKRNETKLSLQLNIPLYQGGAVSSTSRQAAANYDKAWQEHELQRRATERQARTTYLSVLSNISRANALKQALRSSQTALEATRVGYEVGTRTAVDVLDSQRELFRAQRNYARARYDYILETLRLKQAAGTLARNDLQLVNAWLQ